MTMTLIRCLPALAVLCTLSLSPALRAQEVSLFNGRDLTGWKGLPQFWSVQDGAITGRVTSKNASGGNTFLVWQGGEVTDFELSLKFKLEAHNSERAANSGIQFRAFLSKAERFGLRGYQVELDPGTQQPNAWPTRANHSGGVTEDPPGMLLAAVGQKARLPAGESSRMAAPSDILGSLGTEQSVPASYRQNDWNECRVIAVGNHIQTFINGLPAVDLIDAGNRYMRGLIGFQLHNPTKEKTVQFKDIKLRFLTGIQPAQELTAAPVQPLVLDPNQPLLETFSQLAPNASAWVLAALDEGVPPNVRQNLIYLREDLLDEYKQKPKASQDAYKYAHQLCTTMIAALDERDKTLVRAGFRAVQADANASTTGSQALNARRNYMMSWPQYAREESQRAELRTAASNQAQVMKEQPKVEWSNRTAALRRTLDDLYSQFREALRQSAAAK